MSDSYNYIDPDYTYTDPDSGIRRNLQNIKDPEVLIFVESSAVAKRLQELYQSPIKITGIESLLPYIDICFKMSIPGLERSELLK